MRLQSPASTQQCLAFLLLSIVCAWSARFDVNIPIATPWHANLPHAQNHTYSICGMTNDTPACYLYFATEHPMKRQLRQKAIEKCNHWFKLRLLSLRIILRCRTMIATFSRWNMAGLTNDWFTVNIAFWKAIFHKFAISHPITLDVVELICLQLLFPVCWQQFIANSRSSISTVFNICCRDTERIKEAPENDAATAKPRENSTLPHGMLWQRKWHTKECVSLVGSVANLGLPIVLTLSLYQHLELFDSSFVQHGVANAFAYAEIDPMLKTCAGHGRARPTRRYSLNGLLPQKKCICQGVPPVMQNGAIIQSAPLRSFGLDGHRKCNACRHVPLVAEWKRIATNWSQIFHMSSPVAGKKQVSMTTLQNGHRCACKFSSPKLHERNALLRCMHFPKEVLRSYTLWLLCVCLCVRVCDCVCACLCMRAFAHVRVCACACASLRYACMCANVCLCVNDCV